MLYRQTPCIRIRLSVPLRWTVPLTIDLLPVTIRASVGSCRSLPPATVPSHQDQGDGSCAECSNGSFLSRIASYSDSFTHFRLFGSLLTVARYLAKYLCVSSTASHESRQENRRQCQSCRLRRYSAHCLGNDYSVLRDMPHFLWHSSLHSSVHPEAVWNR
jgi:hypothetical protein